MAPGTLSAEQRRLLDRLLDQKGVGSGTAMLQRYAGERASLPMSFAQQRIWFFDRLQPAETIYNVAGAAPPRGRLGTPRLPGRPGGGGPPPAAGPYPPPPT